jgi:hypothetical protein
MATNLGIVDSEWTFRPSEEESKSSLFPDEKDVSTLSSKPLDYADYIPNWKSYWNPSEDNTSSGCLDDNSMTDVPFSTTNTTVPPEEIKNGWKCINSRDYSKDEDEQYEVEDNSQYEYGGNSFSDMENIRRLVERFTVISCHLRYYQQYFHCQEDIRRMAKQWQNILNCIREYYFSLDQKDKDYILANEDYACEFYKYMDIRNEEECFCDQCFVNRGVLDLEPEDLEPEIEMGLANMEEILAATKI